MRAPRGLGSLAAEAIHTSGGNMRAITRGWRAVVRVLLLAALAALAGCSPSGGSHAATATTARPDRVATWRQVIQCLRANGMPNLPDPRFDSNGEPHFPGGDPGDPPERARRACEPIYNRLPPSPRDNDRPPTDIPALLRFARCMREHGLADFPDPKPDGTFPLAGTSIVREGKSPRLVGAAQACRRFNPDPRGSIHGG
jgi:hypothetical protein